MVLKFLLPPVVCRIKILLPMLICLDNDAIRVHKNIDPFVIISGFCIMLCLFSGCGKEAAPEPKLPLVRTQTVSVGSAAQSAEYSGSVHGRYEKNMAFQVGGQIIERSVQLGDRVSAGSVMMRIDPKDVAQKTAAADAQAEAAGAQLALAETNLARYRQLYAEAAIAAAVLD